MKLLLFLAFLFFFAGESFSQDLPQVKIDGVGIFPNPFNEKLFIQTENQLKKIEIYGEDGQKVAQVKQDNIVDATELKNGIYTLKLYFEDQVIVRRVLKKQ